MQYVWSNRQVQASLPVICGEVVSRNSYRATVTVKHSLEIHHVGLSDMVINYIL